MKKLITLAFIMLAVASCNKEEDAPGISVNPTTASLTTDGGTVNTNVTAGGEWAASCTSSNVTVSPTSAQGDSPVSITVDPNTTGSSRTIEVVFTCKKGGNKATMTITQEFYEEPVAITVSDCPEKWDFAGYTVKVTVNSNYPWTSVLSGEGFSRTPETGPKGTTEVTIVIPKNSTKEELLGTVDFSASSITETKGTGLSFYVMAPWLKYGDDEYSLVKMKDGNIWMAENLRYVPQGITPSSDLKNVTAGIYNPVKLNTAHDAIEFTTDADVVKANGYFYQSEVALGLKVGDITSEDQAKALEGTRGICPEGWHIPTATEIINLVGRAVSPYEIKTDAPYYDAEKGNATIAKLNEDGFNAAACGAVTIQDNTKTEANLMGWVSKYPDIISSGYICGSTYTGKTEKDSKITNFQFLGFMPMANNGTFNGAKLSYRIGANVRCVMDTKKAE